MISEKKKIFEIVDTLSQMGSFKSEQVCKTVGLDTVTVAQDSSPAFTVSKSNFPGNEFIVDMEIRAPAGRLASTGGLVILNLQPSVKLNRTDVVDHYGPEDYVPMLKPEEPQDQPEYLVYKKDWGTLAMGVERTEAGLLRRIILNAHKHD